MIDLRPYQHQAIDGVRDAFRAGAGRVAVRTETHRPKAPSLRVPRAAVDWPPADRALFFATLPGCAHALRRGAAVPADPGFMDGSAVHVTDPGVSSQFQTCALRPAALRIFWGTP
jgi:hypothetical protein